LISCADLYTSTYQRRFLKDLIFKGFLKGIPVTAFLIAIFENLLYIRKRKQLHKIFFLFMRRGEEEKEKS
jgi:hypothetical protein